MSEIDLVYAYFCEKCFKDNSLVEIVKAHGKSIEACDICRTENVYGLTASHPLLKSAFRALIRINYSEWDYNGHLGGDDLSIVLFGRNNIMNLSADASEEEFER